MMVRYTYVELREIPIGERVRWPTFTLGKPVGVGETDMVVLDRNKPPFNRRRGVASVPVRNTATGEVSFWEKSYMVWRPA